MTPEIVNIKLDTDILAIIKTGDLGRLSEQQQLQYYIYECNRIGLDPASRPFVWLKLNGKLVLYADRRCGDMLSTKHGFTTEIVEGPCIKEFGNVSVLYCRARARGTNGRSAEDVGTLPTSDIVNGVMKVLSKAVRRATLRLAGWGGLDETEIETIPEHAKSPAASLATETEPPDYDPSIDAAFNTFQAAVQGIEMPYEAVIVWIRHRGDIASMPSAVRKEAWRILCWRVEDVGKMASGEGHGWLRENISAEEARNAATMPGQTGGDSEGSRADQRYVPKSVIDAVTKHESPLPLLAASAIWHDHALDGSAWSAEERDATLAYLQDRARVSSEELKRAINVEQRLPDAQVVDPMHNIEPARPQATVVDGSDAQDQREQIVDQWMRDVQAARSVDELRDIYAEAQRSTTSPPWNSETGPAALKDLASLCAKRKTERKTDLVLPGSFIGDTVPQASQAEQRFTAYVMAKTDRFELERGIERHLAEYDLDAETIIRIAAPRLFDLASGTKYSLTSMQSVNTVRAIANGTQMARREE